VGWAIDHQARDQPVCPKTLIARNPKLRSKTLALPLREINPLDRQEPMNVYRQTVSDRTGGCLNACCFASVTKRSAFAATMHTIVGKDPPSNDRIIEALQAHDHLSLQITSVDVAHLNPPRWAFRGIIIAVSMSLGVGECESAATTSGWLLISVGGAPFLKGVVRKGQKKA
jgi:hypothetical protein